MEKKLKLSDFREMLDTSESVGGTLQEDRDIDVQVTDEDGNLYYIKDVRYFPLARCIAIEFSHDDLDD